jgi:hypothetical protein
VPNPLFGTGQIKVSILAEAAEKTSSKFPESTLGASANPL